MADHDKPLEPITEDWQRGLAVVAHPDDMEFGAAAAIARWTGQGKDIVYCMVTSGEAGIDSMQPDEAGPLREAEQRESADIVGVSQVDFLHQPDGVLEYGVELRRHISEVIRRHRPEIVITNNFREHWPGGPLNQADHIATGRATLDAVRDAGNRWVFPEQLTGGLERWDGVQEVWLAASPYATHGVDVTDTFDVGLRSLKAHRAYIEGLGWFEPTEFLTTALAAQAQGLGTTYATSFEVLRP